MACISFHARAHDDSKGGPRKKQQKKRGVHVCVLSFLPHLESFTFKGIYLYSSMALGRSLDSFEKQCQT